MNYYGELARRHWEKHRPTAYAAINDRDEFFTMLGEQISDQIAVLAAIQEGEPSPGETFMARVGRLNMAKLLAEEQVLREMLPSSEESLTEEGSDVRVRHQD